MIGIFRLLNRSLGTSKPQFSFLNGSNSNYIDELYELWKSDNSSVHKSWHLIFKAVENGSDISEYLNPANSPLFVRSSGFKPSVDNQVFAHDSSCADNRDFCRQHTVYNLIHAYQCHGHLTAAVDPFQGKYCRFVKNTEMLDLSTHGLDSAIDQKFRLPANTYIGNGAAELPLNEIVRRLKEAYSSSIGLEFGHIDNMIEVEWLKQRVEKRIFESPSNEDQIQILDHLVKSTLFEGFLAKKYPAEKRFGLEGCETLISLLKEIIEQASVSGVDNIVMGMAHRGRLNVLTNVCGQPLNHIFMRFNDELEMEGTCSSDVKYHLGVSKVNISQKTGKEVKVSMLANPSHLEAVNGVVKGRVKAEQYLGHDLKGDRIMPLLLHGDAAFAGQGIVFETINISGCKWYSVGGTIHIVTNNQIGFTTNPEYSRSTYYCTEVGKVSKAPIIHVNANDPDAVCFVAKLAADYRNTFKKDIIIDLIGYRRNGHNEGDNPQFTQPQMYQEISTMPNVLEIYSKKLIDSNVITSDFFEEVINKYESVLNKEFDLASQAKSVENKVWIDSPWKNFFKHEKDFSVRSTGFDTDSLVLYQKKCAEFPDGFSIHPGIKRALSQRMEILDQGVFDWAMGEIAAFSSLLTTGYHVRLSGQDAERGTFSHRHHVFNDIKNIDSCYCALDNLDPTQERYTVCNSPLSEYAILGYEHGYSMASPKILAIWEGQFGDFSNNAQTTIDQFISSGEDKWIRQSGLVMLLPHGFDGMGPEHSSARLERYLQLSREDPDVFPSYDKSTFEVEQLSSCNYIVAFPTTPANMFHLLRRQVIYGFRKPLIVMSPKNLLRHVQARSNVSEFGPGTSFKRLIPEDGKCIFDPSKVKRVIFCSGKVYYELFQTRNDFKLEDEVAIVRIEQISPFPFDLVSEEISKYPNADIMYVQEEPKNQGAYYFVKPMILLCTKYSKPLLYSGREVSASPATGSKHRHNIEQKNLLNNAFKI